MMILAKVSAISSKKIVVVHFCNDFAMCEYDLLIML